VAGIGAENDGVAALPMKFENRLPFFGDADGPAPAMSEIHVLQCGMKAVNAFLQEREEIFGLSLRDVNQ